MTDSLQIDYRLAGLEDIHNIKDLIFTHGPNQWNYLPREETEAHIEDIACGKTLAIVAFDGTNIIGVVTFIIGNLGSFSLGKNFLPVHTKDLDEKRLGYIAEAVVHSSHWGKGIGAALLEGAKHELHKRGVKVIYLKRHEENAASAGIMRKAGFIEILVFDNPEIRTSGSRRTSVSRYEFFI